MAGDKQNVFPGAAELFARHSRIFETGESNLLHVGLAYKTGELDIK